MIALFIPVKAAKRKGKKVVLLPHSTYKMGKFGTWMTMKFVKNFDYIFTREDYSYQVFRNLKNTPVKSQIDLCFFDNINELKHRATPKSINKIALTLRSTSIGDIGNLTEDKVMKLKTSLKSLVSELDHPNAQFNIVIQTKKDKDFSIEMSRELETLNNVVVKEEYDTFNLIDYYRNMDLVIGMRLHSLILASSVGTPIFGLFSNAWGLKNQGTLNKLKLNSIIIENQLNNDIKNLVKYNLENFDHSKEIILNHHKKLLTDLQEYLLSVDL